MALGELLGTIGIGSGGTIYNLIIIVSISLCAAAAGGGIIWYFVSRRQWNIRVEFKLPRSVGYNKDKFGRIDVNSVEGFVLGEIGKGSYNAKKGTVFLKRKKKKKIAMKPFNVNRYLQGDVLTVVQVGAEEYLPVLPTSYLIYTDEETKEDCALLKLNADVSQSRAWKNSFEREAKQAFSIASLLREYAPYIAIGLVIFLWGVQMLLLYNRLR